MWRGSRLDFFFENYIYPTIYPVASKGTQVHQMLTLLQTSPKETGVWVGGEHRMWGQRHQLRGPSGTYVRDDEVLPGSSRNWTGPSNGPFGRTRGSGVFQPHKVPQQLPGSLYIPHALTPRAPIGCFLTLPPATSAPDSSASSTSRPRPRPRLFLFPRCHLIGPASSVPSLSLLLGRLPAPQKCQPMGTDQKLLAQPMGRGREL